MFILSPIINLIALAIDLYILIVIVRAILSWMGQIPRSRFVRLIYFYTEPPLQFIREILPSFGGIDFSPMILIFLLYTLKSLLLFL